MAMWCADLKRQRDFFQETLGHAIRYEADDLIVLDTNGPALVLHQADESLSHLNGTLQIGFYVDGLDAWYDHLLESGGEVWRSDAKLEGGYRLLAVKTPGGQFLALAGK